jgi:hypothetical protein
MYEAVVSIVRSASAAAFIAEYFAVAATSGELDWATWRRFNLGWRFWMGLGSSGAFLALACLVVYLLLAVSRRSLGEGKLKDARWCVWLNIATIALSLFVPAIAAV